MMPTTGPNSMRVLVADRDVLVRDGVTAQLQGHGDLMVVALAGTANTAIEASHRHKPDVVVLDAELVAGEDINLCSQIKAVSSRTRCIIHAATALTTDNTEGADAVVLKQLLGNGLADTIRHITGQFECPPR